MLAFLEFLLFLAIVLILVTQVTLPAFRRQKLFPIFRKQGKLERELDDAKQAVAEHNIEVQIEETLKTIQPVEAAPVPDVKTQNKTESESQKCLKH